MQSIKVSNSTPAIYKSVALAVLELCLSVGNSK